MIVVGYYGVGKSTAAQKHYEIVDIAPKYFKKIDKMDDGSKSEWIENGEGLKRYIWLVKDLNKEGFIVCVPPTKDVRAAIKEDKEILKKEIVYICPRIDEKNEWMKHLYARWDESQSLHDEMTFERARANYESDIKDMIDDDVKIIWVDPGMITRNGLFAILQKEEIIR